MQNDLKLQPRVCVTGQHREMLDAVLRVFGVTPDWDLRVMAAGQTLLATASRVLADLERVFVEARPQMVVVQGDTTSAFCGALAGFYQDVPVAHVEAGLRTHDLRAPFPEEINRVLAGRLASLHFPATQWAAENLRREGIAESDIRITGNTGIDAVVWMRDQLAARIISAEGLPAFVPYKKLILVTAHRRENFGEAMQRICQALLRLAQRQDVEIVYPVHPNPNVRQVVERELAGQNNITLLPPLEYPAFVELMRRAFILITDSGGVQEEGPSLGKPILVLRQRTERPEAVEAGTVRLVGTDVERIVAEAEALLDDPVAYGKMARLHNPYGDGHASERIASRIAEYLQVAPLKLAAAAAN